MSRPWMGYLAGAAFALSAAAAATAYAQSSAPDADARDHVRTERHVIIRDGDGNREFEIGHHRDMGEHLSTLLQLKPSQQPALAAYLAATKPQHMDHHVVEMSNKGDARTTPQRLAEVEARMAENTAATHARIEATRRFYDQLEPSQKKVFDELPMLMIGPIGPIGPMMLPSGPMKVMISSRHFDGVDRFEPPIPPLPPRPPHPPKAPPAPPVPPVPPQP
ncbi:Spy/CpxP family protein refolding chaperone [Phenylobacterium sp.]|uniref:Spy/CpxP family protein refolding chaperone n=1 Tax=Phenylobacterium sp. TaxID=1871053 RepID=UPI003563D681